MYLHTKNVKFHFRWGTKPRDQKQETGNDCDIISGLEASQKTDFSDIFLFSYLQRTFAPFLGELISGEGKSLSNIFFLLYLSVHWGDFIEQIKKSVIYMYTSKCGTDRFQIIR